MGVRVNTGSGVDPSLVQQLISLEKLPIQRIEKRKERVVEEQKLYNELKDNIIKLSTALNSLKNPTDFRKLKLESSHPDIIDGTVDNTAVPGSYEMEVRRTAKSMKLLAEGFPDKDKTPVGFGFMSIELDDGETFDVDIDPDASTLNDVVQQINSMARGVKAIVINTKEHLEFPGEDNYRLIVISEKSGKEGKIYIDPDTTYLEFKEQVTGRNMEALFEDVPIFDEDNNLEDLLPGMVLNVKRAEPGTKINVSIDYDVEATFEDIKSFVDSYNAVNGFIDKQFQVDPQTNKSGMLSKDNTLRALRRTLRTSLRVATEPGSKYSSLAQLGVTSDSKTGDLKLDETKVKQALSEDYNAVAKVFVQGENSVGAAASLASAIRTVRDPKGGYLSSKEREFKRILKNFDRDIDRAQRVAQQREVAIRRRFTALESVLAGLNAQGQYLQARLGGASAPTPQISAAGGG